MQGEKYFFALLKVAISALLIFFLFERVDLRAVYDIYAHSSGGLLVLAFLIILAGESLCVLRLKILLAARSARYTFTNLFRVYFMGAAIGNFLPSSVGSDVFKFFLLRRYGNGSREGIATCFVADRAGGFLAMLVIFLIAALAAETEVAQVWQTVVGALTPSSFIVAGAIIAAAAALGLWFREFFLKVGKELLAFTGHPRAIVSVFALSLVYQLLLVCAVYIIYTAVAGTPTVPFLLFFVFVPVVNLITALPISINGIGVREWLFVLLFAPLSAVPSEMVAVSLMILFFIILESALGGLFFLGYDRGAGGRPLQM